MTQYDEIRNGNLEISNNNFYIIRFADLAINHTFLRQLRPVLHCKHHQTILRVNIELLTNAVSMILDSAVAYEQLFGDRFTRLALRDKS